MVRHNYLLALVLVVSLITAPMTVVALPNETGSSKSDANIQPGVKLAGVIAVQEAELDGELQRRTFLKKLAKANSNSTKAKVVAEMVEDLKKRLKQLKQRKQRLIQSKKNGSISVAKFRAEITELVARIANVRALANQSKQVAQRLPAELLRQKGINVSAIQQLAQHADELTGQQVSEIAQSIAGKNVGTSMAENKKPGDLPDVVNRTNGSETPEKGPPETPQNGTDTPEKGTDTPEKGTDTPKKGTDTPEKGTETPTKDTPTSDESTTTTRQTTTTEDETTTTSNGR
ncbi:MAG: hypothetical protein ABEI06_09525 [Halobacteriaceae archaeon]